MLIEMTIKGPTVDPGPNMPTVIPRAQPDQRHHPRAQAPVRDRQLRVPRQNPRAGQVPLGTDHHGRRRHARILRDQADGVDVGDGRVRHPHVVAPTGWAAEDDLVLLAMDLVPGGSAQQLLDEHGPVPVGYAARLLEQLLMGLAAVHAAGLVHRDVKPANLLLDAHGAVWVTDFGLAKLIDQDGLTSTGDILGTLQYMAPESFENRADARSDGASSSATETRRVRRALDRTSHCTVASVPATTTGGCWRRRTRWRGDVPIAASASPSITNATAASSVSDTGPPAMWTAACPASLPPMLP